MSIKVVAKATNTETATLLVSRTSDQLCERVEKILISEVEHTTTPSCFSDNFASQILEGIQENRKSGQVGIILGILEEKRRKKGKPQLPQVKKPFRGIQKNKLFISLVVLDTFTLK